MSDQTESTLLAALAERVGIAAEYHDISGARRVTADHTKRAILRVMGFQVDSTAALAVSIRDWDEASWRRPCDSVRVMYEEEAGAPLLCCFALEDGKEQSVVVQLKLRNEAGEVVQDERVGPGLTVAETRVLDGCRHVLVELPIPTRLSLGYYELTIAAEGLVGGSVATMRLIVAPRQCYVPPALESGRRFWGLALQLY